MKDEKPSIVSISDRDGNVITDRMSVDEKLRRFDSHRVAHRKMAMAEKKRDIPESGESSPPAQYDIYDFDDQGLIFAAALAAIVAFIVLFF